MLLHLGTSHCSRLAKTRSGQGRSLVVPAIVPSGQTKKNQHPCMAHVCMHNSVNCCLTFIWMNIVMNSSSGMDSMPDKFIFDFTQYRSRASNSRRACTSRGVHAKFVTHSKFVTLNWKCILHMYVYFLTRYSIHMLYPLTDR